MLSIRLSPPFSPLTHLYPLQYDEEELQSAVGLVRPSSVAFEVVNDFRFYKNGVYESLDCRSDPNVSPGLLLHSWWLACFVRAWKSSFQRPRCQWPGAGEALNDCFTSVCEQCVSMEVPELQF